MKILASVPIPTRHVVIPTLYLLQEYSLAADDLREEDPPSAEKAKNPVDKERVSGTKNLCISPFSEKTCAKRLFLAALV